MSEKFSDTKVGEVLGAASGLSKSAMNELWEAAKANQTRLRSCLGPHDFSRDLTPDRKIGKKWACLKCDGEIDDANRIWYQRGLDHGATARSTSSVC
ncbi:MAG: hypothetical protein E6Q97_29635, partial [Desulfurellales bacterium]